MEKHDTNNVVIEKDGKYLLIRRGNEPNKGKWAFPGGHKDQGETNFEAAQREANEEIGEVRVEEKPFAVFEHNVPGGDKRVSGKPHTHTDHIFRAVVSGKLRAGDDAEEIGWFSLDEIKKMDITLATKMVIERMKS